MGTPRKQVPGVFGGPESIGGAAPGGPNGRRQPAPTTYDYNDIPVGYYDHIYNRRRGVQSKWHHLKFARFAAAMAGYRRHLDIGCGPGTFIGALPDGVHESVGVDIAPAQIGYALRNHSRGERNFLLLDGNQLPFRDGKFDVVTSVELLEHVSRAEGIRLLREAHRILKPGGRILLSTPNYGSLWPLIEKLVNMVGEVDYAPQHITLYNRGTLDAMIGEAGFHDVRVEGYMLSAPFVAAISWRGADIVAGIEPAIAVDRLGLLLFASGEKHAG